MAKKATEYLKKGRLASSSIGLKGAAADWAISTYMNVKNGQSLGRALLSGGGEALAFAIAPKPMMAIYGGQMIGAGIKAGYQAQTRLEGNYRKRTDTGPSFTYRDTNQAMTMRQAGVQAIQGSKMNARNALGGEAALMHRSKKIY
jgi:hypothetical protein